LDELIIFLQQREWANERDRDILWFKVLNESNYQNCVTALPAWYK